MTIRLERRGARLDDTAAPINERLGPPVSRPAWRFPPRRAAMHYLDSEAEVARLAAAVATR